MAQDWFFYIGLLACLIILSGIGLSLIGFKGMKGEPFNILNHFISELGDPRFALHYRLFNLTLIIGGIFLIPFIVGWGITFNSTIGTIAVILGIIVAILCSLIGVFPEHKEKEHFNIAGLFFIGMTLLILLVGIILFIDNTSPFPKWFLIINLIPCMMSFIFVLDTLLLPKWEYLRTYKPWDWEEGRPSYWRNPFLEWLAFLSMMGWLCVISSAGLILI